MKFSAREDIAASPEVVFAALTDFQKFERMALRRGAEVQRTDRLTQPGPGMSWAVGFVYRGRTRNAEVSVTAFDPNHALTVQALVQGMTSLGEMELFPLGPSKTRLQISFDVRPETFRTRMLLRGLRLGKSRLNERFKQRVARFGREIEGR